ncbi:DNA primase family protein, partial [Alicyclobacillus sendaiensis]|uniref:DNA primase family protein n=1 Tax=Alicyclobacillus sendaiensis TaxID=192387 RepID=UPI0026F40F34
EERNVDDAKIASVFDTEMVFPVLNGLVDVSKGYPVLRDFTPDCRVTWQINVEWRPQWEQGPRHWTLDMQQAQKDIDEFLRLYDFSAETLQAFLEALGYTLARFDIGEQRYFILLGPGYNGKGTFLRILEAMCGKFVETVTLQELAENRFAAGRLARAAVNIVADASNQTLRDTETIKKLTGNDLLTAEMKYRDAFPFRPRLKLWMAANYLPPTPDTSFGFFRRPLIFPFHKQFPMMAADWEKRLHTKEALSYLFYLAVKYYLNMRLEGRRLTESPELRRVRMDYWAANDVVQAAIQNGIFEFPKHDREASQYVVPRALATKALELFAEELGRKKVSTSTLFER